MPENAEKGPYTGKYKGDIRWVSLISGGGTTMEAMVTACQEGQLLYGRILPVAVVSSTKSAGGLEKAHRLRIPTEVVEKKKYPKGDKGVEPFGKALIRILTSYHPDIVTMNGFTVKVSKEVIESFKMRNQHPGDPALGGNRMVGLRVHASAIFFVRRIRRPDPWTRVICQRVDPEFDRGAVVKSAEVPILGTDMPEDLQQRALPVEHQVQIGFLDDFANGIDKDEKDLRPFVDRKNQSEVFDLIQARIDGINLYPRI
jgi:folate-dependent phosphoribosylglycinamide formyltransferase PurN